jgi:iron complex transport system ATP-binding protein
MTGDLTGQMSLQVADLEVGYGRTTVLRGVTLPPVRPGEVVAVVGPNGTGKSTLLKAVAGILPAAGTVRVGGRDRSPGDDRVLYIPQEPPPPSSLTVFEAVLLARRRGGRAAVERAGAVLADLALADLATRPIARLSGGQRQLVGLAQAVVREPAVMLLDEPTSNLDLRNQLQILGLVRRIAAEQPSAVLLTLHDLTLAARFTDRAVVLHGGAVHSAGDPADVITPEMLREVYRIDATVHRADDGTVSVAATRSL